jgi:CO/xanthine dehydrogenase Mo-binding subunit
VADLWITAQAVEAAGRQMASRLKAKGAKGRPGLVVNTSYRVDQAPVPAGAFLAEVEVDPQTGIVTLLRLVQALGAGASEPLLAAKAEGDALRGVGYALFERAGAGGPRLRTLDLPSVSTLLTGEGRPRPLGVAPLGDVAYLGAAAAVANAVARACGVRIGELPLTPERVLMALEALT